MPGDYVLRRIAVGVDLETSSIRAAHWAARAFGQDVEFVLVHALGSREPPPFLEGAVAPLEERTAAARELARTRAEELAEDLPGGSVSIEIRRGRPADVLAAVAAERRADMIVLGEHAPRPGVRGSLGSSASQLPLVSPVPVLIKRHLPEGQPRRLLAAVDHSGASEAVLGWIGALSSSQRGAVEVLVHMSLEPEWSGEQDRPVERGRSGGDLSRLALGRAWLTERAEQAGLQGAAIDVTAGDPRYEILAVQRRHAVELVVVGRRGGGAAVSPVIGSVADAVLRSASCSVLVV